MKLDALDDEALEAEQVIQGPFRVTPGFIAFAGMLLMPAVLALGVFVGAALVVDDVKAAQAQSVSSAAAPSGGGDVAGWKRTLVGICPVH